MSYVQFNEEVTIEQVKKDFLKDMGFDGQRIFIEECGPAFLFASSGYALAKGYSLDVVSGLALEAVDYKEGK